MDEAKPSDRLNDKLSDKLSGSCPEVIVASMRDLRPRSGKGSVCPFCKGSEQMTPPALYALPDASDWQIRVFANLYPFFSADPDSASYGVHEVIVETQRHDATLESLTVKEIARVFGAIKARMQHHKENERLKVIFAFRNQGSLGGASLEHPHTQLVGMSWAPPRIAAEHKGFLEMAEKGECPCCLSANDPLIAAEEQSFRAFSPRVPRFPREIWLAPVRHEPSFTELKPEAIDDLASLLKKVLLGLSAIFKNAHRPEAARSPKEPETSFQGFDYNLVLHTEPLEDQSGTFHMHIEILPRMHAIAGFEIGSGTMVNPVAAEDAATALRETMAQRA